jgi:hypothetical protein
MKVTREQFEAGDSAVDGGSYDHDVFSFVRDGTTVSFRRYADSVGVAQLFGTWPQLRSAVGVIRDAIDHLRSNEGIDDILAYHPVLGAYAPSRTQWSGAGVSLPEEAGDGGGGARLAATAVGRDLAGDVLRSVVLLGRMLVVDTASQGEVRRRRPSSHGERIEMVQLHLVARVAAVAAGAHERAAAPIALPHLLANRHRHVPAARRRLRRRALLPAPNRRRSTWARVTRKHSWSTSASPPPGTLCDGACRTAARSATKSGPTVTRSTCRSGAIGSSRAADLASGRTAAEAVLQVPPTGPIPGSARVPARPY